MKPSVDYSLYLVTDSTSAILGERDICEVVQQAVQGGVTVVQLRDKASDTAVLIETAKKLHSVCKHRNVPLIINDRVDVALAVGCEGVHLGQDDMSIPQARQILGDDKIIGATVSSTKEARVAIDQGADYLGIGTVYSTATKKNTKSIIGVNGLRNILRFVDRRRKQAAQDVPTVCIGGINASNAQLVQYQSHANGRGIDGVAIVSAIMAAERPAEAARHLRQLLSEPPPFKAKSGPGPSWKQQDLDEIHALQSKIPETVKALEAAGPLSHNMTNLVVQNFAASVALAIGASPIMSNNGDEASDLARLGGGLVINMGTATPDALLNHRKAIAAYNAVGGPIVLDPVGAGATSARKGALAFLLASGYFDLIKGNEREIIAVARASGFTLNDATQQRGVDSGNSVFTFEQRCYIVSRVAQRQRNIVLMTGSTDIISDGEHTYAINNGHAYLGMVTGSGCSLGTTLTAYMAIQPAHKLLACLAGTAHYEIAAERAAVRIDVKGPGTFIPAFIDELYNARVEAKRGGDGWWNGIKAQLVREIEDFRLLEDEE